jgi:hypothetical protein
MGPYTPPGGKPIISEQGTPIDESKAKNIQVGVHKKQDIEMWFGKPERSSTYSAPNHRDPDGCVEIWSCHHFLMRSNRNLPVIENMMFTESLGVLFNKDGTVCRWSLTGSPMNMSDTKSMRGSIQSHPIDQSKARSIKNGVQTKTSRSGSGCQGRWVSATG